MQQPQRRGRPSPPSAETNRVRLPRYNEVGSSVFRDPTQDPTQDLAVIDTVATGDEAASLRDQFRQVEQAVLTVTGSVGLLRQ